MVRHAIPFVLLLGVISGWCQATEISLSVEPPSPVANESFRLVFSADAPVDAEPDFAELDSVVEIIGRNRQTSIQWINGRHSQTTSWVLDVLVRAAGPLKIPAVAFGHDRSLPLALQLSAAAGAANAPDDSGLLLELEVDTQTPYVQQQVILVTRLLRRVELNDANLTDPSSDADAIIKRMGEDSTYQTMRNQQRYEVFERRYAIFPQTSGTVTIAPMVLTAQIVQSTRSVFDPFRQSVKTRRVESNTITLNVKPIPPGYAGTTWLPAKRLRLRDEWNPDTDEIPAGEPLTRSVILWAEGLNAGQLPEVPITVPAGLKSYPDQPQTDEQSTDGGFTAIRDQKYAMIAGSPSSIVFPELALTWWNTETDAMETARLPERRFDIVPAAGTVTSDPTAPDANAVMSGQGPEPETLAPAPAQPSPPSTVVNYRAIAAVCLLGWVATALAWWRRSRRAGAQTAAPEVDALNDSLSRARRDVRGACTARDAQGLKRALIRWGRLVFAEPGLLSLGEIADRIGEPLKLEVRRLDRSLYGREAAAWDHQALLQAFEHSDIRPDARAARPSASRALPDLYRLSG